MPAPSTIDEFLELVRKSNVLDEKKLDAYLEKSRAALPPDPGQAAGYLIRDGILTRFQAEQFLLGKWRRFHIGKYKVLERLGSGGMGSVYLCEHRLMRRRVAVKVLPTAKADDPSSLERFYREARAVAALDHPNIVRAYDIDQDEKLHFLVMEYVDGASFQEIVKKSGPMDVLRACHYVRQSCFGLQHAHDSAALVHRDIKPGNILVDRNGVVKILDMGLALFFNDQDDIITRKYDENVLGTADYLAPEQALDSHAVDIRADVYSLGATFYFCLTGKAPFSEGTVAQKLIWHQTRQPKPIRHFRPEVPDGLVSVIDRMMAKDPVHRYQTPQAVSEALAPFTGAPIGPPPEAEMPRLSPAAAGGASSSADLGPVGIASAGPFAPPSRRAWQVPASPSPAPSRPPSNAPATPPPTRDSGGGPTPRAQAAVPQPADLRANVVANGPSAPAPTLRLTIPQRPTPSATAVVPAVAPAPGEENTPNWEQLAPDTDDPIARGDTSPTAPRRSGLSSRSRLREALAPPGPGALSRRGLVVLAVGLAGFLFAVVFLVVVLVRTTGRTATNRLPSERKPLGVQRDGKDNAFRTVAAALSAAGPGDTIVVFDDLIEAPLDLNGRDRRGKDVTLRAGGGRKVVWRPSPGRGDGPLIKLNYVEGFCLDGFILDGGSRATNLIVLGGDCPGLKLTNLELKGFKNAAILATNCAGSRDKPVLLQGLRVEATPANEAALIFRKDPNVLSPPTNQHILVHNDCRFLGERARVKFEPPEPSTAKDVTLPPGLTQK